MNDPGKRKIDEHAAASATVSTLPPTSPSSSSQAQTDAEGLVVAPVVDSAPVVKKKSRSAFSQCAERRWHEFVPVSKVVQLGVRHSTKLDYTTLYYNTPHTALHYAALYYTIVQ